MSCFFGNPPTTEITATGYRYDRVRLSNVACMTAATRDRFSSNQTFRRPNADFVGGPTSNDRQDESAAVQHAGVPKA